MEHLIRNELTEASNTLEAFTKDTKAIASIANAIASMVDALGNGGKIISCGNGGSMCDAMHFAEELSGRFRNDRSPLPAIAISDPSHITCTANDYGFDMIFARYVEAIGNSNDVLLAISTSGNSSNIIKAVETAKEKRMKVISLTGKDGGKLAGLSDVEIRVPHFGFADRIQEVHIKIIHCLILGIEHQMFKK
jgi:D-sedoheptulose 7-phosphate isomerase